MSPVTKARLRRTCRRKVRYTDPVGALRAFSDMANQGAIHLMAYRCRWCEGFHLGGVRVRVHKRTAAWANKEIILKLILRGAAG